MNEFTAGSRTSIGPGLAWGLDAELMIARDGEPVLWWSPDRVSGQLAIAGSRLPVETPLRALAEGASLGEIAESWRSASPEVMKNVLELALVGLNRLVEAAAKQDD
jgi:uncharacterized protein (DUF433 family)